MPNRIIRDGILTSEPVDRLTCGAEIFYRRAMSIVDDYGRYYAKTELLMCGLYPLRPGRVTAAEIEGWLRECDEAGLIAVYEVDGKRFLEILKFRQHIRATKGPFAGSKFPPNPVNELQAKRNCSADVSQEKGTGTASARLVVDVDVGVDVSRAGHAPSGLEGQLPSLALVSPAVTVQRSDTGSQEFGAAWGKYPKREGGNSKTDALKAWSARLREGISAKEMLEGVERYANFVRAKGKEGTEFVQQASTFLGPGKHFQQEWTIAQPAPTRESAQIRGAVL